MFIDKIGAFFGKKGNGKTEQNGYYGTVAARYGTMSRILLVLLTFLVIITLLFFNDWISYDNFYYFFSDFGGYLTSADLGIDGRADAVSHVCVDRRHGWRHLRRVLII